MKSLSSRSAESRSLQSSPATKGKTMPAVPVFQTKSLQPQGGLKNTGLTGVQPVMRKIVDVKKDEILEQTGANCGLFSFFTAVQKLTGAEVPDEKKREAQTAAMAKGSSVGELFNREQINAVATKLGVTVTYHEVPKTTYKTVLKDLSDASADYVLMAAYSFTDLMGVGTPGQKGAQGAHWSMISNYEEATDTIHISNPHKTVFNKTGDAFMDSNIGLKGANFDWEKFSTTDTSVSFPGVDGAAITKDSAATTSNYNDKVTKKTEALDIGGYILAIQKT